MEEFIWELQADLGSKKVDDFASETVCMEICQRRE